MNNRPLYFRRDGTPYKDTPEKPACIAWSEEWQKHKRVCKTKLPWGGWLSTVWLGLDHSFLDGPPKIFETMLFRSEDDLATLDSWRWSTEKEAIAGHAKLVLRFKNGPPDNA